MAGRFLGEGTVLRTSAAPYLVVGLGTEILIQGLGAFTNGWVLHPDAPWHRVVYVLGMLACVVLWFHYRESDKPTLFRVAVGLMLALWALALWRGLEVPKNMQADTFTLPLLLAMMWIKPPTARDARLVADAVAWIFVGFFVVWLGLEVSGAMSSWYGPSAAGQAAAAADRAYYALPLADPLGLDGRWAGPFSHPNSAGPVGGFLLIMALCRRGAGRWVFLASGLAILLLTGSRTSTIAALGGVVVVLAVTWLLRRPTTLADRILMGVVPLSLVGLLVVAANRSIVGAPRDATLAGQLWQANSTMNGRTEMWSAYWNLWLDSPFLGVPSGVIADAVRSGAIPAWAAASAHNALLDALARTGLVGAALVIATAVVAVWLAIRAARWGQVMPIGVLGLLIVSGFSEALVSWQWPSASTTLLLLAVVGSLGPERPQAAGLDQRTEIASSTEA